MNVNSESGDCFRSDQSQSTSSSLIERAKRREEGAWERMAVQYGPLVYRWCRQFGLQPQDAADVAQDVFLVVIGAIAGFRGGRTGAFRSWLRTITRNKVHDVFRHTEGQARAAGGSAAARQLLQLPEFAAPADESPTDESEDDAWQCAIAQLRAEFPAHVWQAFWRVTVDAVPARDVAQELSMSVAAVYQAKSRVLRRLRQALGDLDVGE